MEEQLDLHQPVQNGALFEPEVLPTIYLVDNRTNCHELVNETGEISVKFIGKTKKALQN